MLVQIGAAQFDLENSLAEMSNSGGQTDAVRSSLQVLGDLRRQIGTANPASLAMLRGEIMAGAASARTIAQQTRAASQVELAQAALAEVDARTRATVERITGDLFEKRVLDPYLQFASTDDEAEYRRREAERKAYIERELARGTPEGSLNASNAAVAQIEDAGAHGADKSPEYDRMRTEAITAKNEQLAAIRAAQKDDAKQTPVAPVEAEATNSDLDEIAAIFNAAGVRAEQDATAVDGHGLTAASTERGGNAAGRSA